MDRTWSTYGADKKCVQFFNGKSERRGHYEYLGTDGKDILKWPKGK
jgi:Zn/Cd-binding protein ZinT